MDAGHKIVTGKGPLRHYQTLNSLIPNKKQNKKNCWDMSESDFSSLTLYCLKNDEKSRASLDTQESDSYDQWQQLDPIKTQILTMF